MIKNHWKKILLITLALVLTGGGVFAYSLYNQADAAVAKITTGSSAVGLLKAEPLNGEDTGVVNILIAGNSADDAGHGGAQLTDSIMVASLNITTKKLTLISIPRDMWVSANGSYMKLNAVYTVGGIDLLQSTVESMTGLAINHRVLINYAAFKQMIDAVGGIDITIDSSDPRGIYDPMIGFSIGNGKQHLDGATALKLVRSRNDPTYDGRVAYGLPGGDFDRAENQRKVVQALLAKVTTVGTLANPAKLSELLKGLSGNVTSNFSAGQLRRLYDLSKQLTGTESISIRGTDENLLIANYTSYDGQSALIPQAGISDYAAIRTYIANTLAVQAATKNTGE
jgi:LCP family protein required for cell wall assembly